MNFDDTYAVDSSSNSGTWDDTNLKGECLQP